MSDAREVCITCGQTIPLGTSWVYAGTEPGRPWYHMDCYRQRVTGAGDGQLPGMDTVASKTAAPRYPT